MDGNSPPLRAKGLAQYPRSGSGIRSIACGLSGHDGNALLAEVYRTPIERPKKTPAGHETSGGFAVRAWR